MFLLNILDPGMSAEGRRMSLGMNRDEGVFLSWYSVLRERGEVKKTTGKDRP
jgi:hypothetical protein